MDFIKRLKHLTFQRKILSQQTGSAKVFISCSIKCTVDASCEKNESVPSKNCKNPKKTGLESVQTEFNFYGACHKFFCQKFIAHALTCRYAIVTSRISSSPLGQESMFSARHTNTFRVERIALERQELPLPASHPETSEYFWGHRIALEVDSVPIQNSRVLSSDEQTLQCRYIIRESGFCSAAANEQFRGASGGKLRSNSTSQNITLRNTILTFAFATKLRSCGFWMRQIIFHHFRRAFKSPCKNCTACFAVLK